MASQDHDAARIDADPLAAYTDRLRDRRDRAERLGRREEQVANLRLAAFASGVALALLAWAGLAHPGWIALPFAVFVPLVPISARIGDSARRARRAVAFYERGLSRLDGTWPGRGEPGSRFLDEAHPYAADLDVFGIGSLFERLCTARTAPGEAALATWLQVPAPPGEVLERQEAVAELAPRLDLNEELALLGEDARAGLDPAALLAWGNEPEPPASRPLRAFAAVLAGLAGLALLAWLAGLASLSPFFAVAIAEAGLALAVRGRVRRALAAVERREAELELLAGLLRRIEREPFRAPWLARLRAGLDAGGDPASARIERLAQLVRMLEWRLNLLFLPLALALNWTTQLGLAIESWRREHGREVEGWLAAVGRLEAIAALALYRFENPADPFPKLLEPGDGPRVEAEGLAHPLLPRDRAVANDLRLGGDLRVIALSGSNMSGKSTWLRTIGANAVLAQAGAPVRARSMRLTPLMPGGTLRVQDSLQSGKSRFYAEITRLRQLFDLARGPVPLLFLLDEVLHGTNSHERLHGAEAIVRRLVDLGAIGLFTTHDLALAEAAERLAPRALNVHFEDQVDAEGRLAFDYKLRPGVVPRSNALALMRAVGLDV